MTDELETQLEGSGSTDKDSKIPERFKGKSMEELVTLYQGLEKSHSQLGNELGQNRKLVDTLLQAELSRASVKETPKEDPPDWAYEPEKAVRNLLNTEVGSLKKELNSLKRSEALKEFEAKHGNLVELSKSMDEEFYTWVNKSKYRSSLANQGIYGKSLDTIDLDAADELLSEFKEIQSYKKPDTEKRDKDLKAAAMEKGASSGGSRAKTWSRNEIVEMRLKDPSKYEANRKEIEAAYREGRVTK